MTELTHVHLPQDEEEVRTPALVRHRELAPDSDGYLLTRYAFAKR